VWIPQKTRQLRDDPYRFVGMTPTSYLSGNHYRDACLKVAELFQLHHPGLMVTLLQDSVRIHSDPTTSAECQKKLMMFHFLIKDGTACCQPLDVRCFGVWASQFQSEVGKVKWSFVDQKDRLPTLMAIAYKVEKHAFQPHIITAAFSAAYIWPWQPTELRNRMQLECANKTPESLDPNVALAADAHNEIAHQQKDDIVTLRSTVSPSKLKRGDSPKNCFELEDSEAEKAAKKAQEEIRCQEKKHRREEAKQELKRQTEQKKLLREERKCAIESCKTSRLSSTKWTECNRCGRSVCPTHTSVFNTHQCVVKKTRKPRKNRRRS
jgi:hypothetical protein